MDLTAAEAVIDLIEAETAEAAANAAGQLGGALLRRLEPVYEDLVGLMSPFHAVLDYPDEDIDDFALRDYAALLEARRDDLDRLLATADRGRVVKQGVRAVILGRPNAGKSSLLNALAGYERVIVTPIPGTTRDTVEDTFVIDGTLLRFIDTAGLRKSEDTLENFGIERTYQALSQAAVVLYLVDATHATLAELEAETEAFRQLVPLEGKELIVVANKIDELESLPADYTDWHDMGVLFISAKRRVNLGDIEERLGQYVRQHKLQDLTLITNERHYALLCEVEAAIGRIRHGLESGLPTDIVAEEVRAALPNIGLLTGSVSTDELLDNIFGKFCIGK